MAFIVSYFGHGSGILSCSMLPFKKNQPAFYNPTPLYASEKAFPAAGKTISFLVL